MDPWCKHKSWPRLPTVVQDNLPSDDAAEAPRVITGKGKGKKGKAKKGGRLSRRVRLVVCACFTHPIIVHSASIRFEFFFYASHASLSTHG